MRRFSILAIALIALGCSSHSTMSSPAAPDEFAPQVFQGYGGGGTWTTVKVIAHQQYVGAVGLLHWHGDGMTALSRSGSINAVLMIAPGGLVTSIPLPEQEVGRDAVGPDGNLWITAGVGQIESVTQAGVVSIYPLPRPNTLPDSITSGPDGALWFDEDGFSNPELGRITTSGVITEYPYPSGVISLPGLVSGSDGNLWGTDGQNVYKITTAGVFTTYPLGVSGSNNGFGIVEAAGDVWTTVGGTVLSVDPSGVVTAYQSPSGFGTDLGVGSDGNLWSLEGSEWGSLGTFNVTTHVFSTVAPPPPSHAFSNGQFMAGPDGDLWTSGCCGSRIVLVYIWRSLTVTPSPLTIAAPGDQSNLSVSETNYTGNWSGSSNNKAVATIARGQTLGTLVVTAVGAGACVLTIGDADHNTVKVKVTVN